MKEPTNRELYILLEVIGKKADRIETHVKETNGKVLKNTAFRWKATGALLVITFLLGIVSWEKVSTLFR